MSVGRFTLSSLPFFPLYPFFLLTREGEVVERESSYGLSLSLLNTLLAGVCRIITSLDLEKIDL
jgi:hypothetical protein